MNELALFAGSGGGILGGILNGWKTVCAVEINEYCQRVLMQRQDDGIFEKFPIWPDITTFDGRPWAGCVDIITGGFPCQDISVAGKGKGLAGERSGLWGEMARIISEVRPNHVFVENSPDLTIRGGTRVIGDLTNMGYSCRWGVVGAHHVGAPHRRDRIWIVSHANGMPSTKPKQQCEMQTKESTGSGATQLESGQDVADANGLRESQQERVKQDEWGWPSDSSCKVNGENMANTNTNSAQRERMRGTIGIPQKYTDSSGSSWWQAEPGMG